MFTTAPVVRFSGDRVVAGESSLAVERPLEFRLGEVPVAVLMCSPGMERELALGFCLTEGILLNPAELVSVTAWGAGDRFQIETTVSIDPERFRRNTYTTSSCGVCGKASIDSVRVSARPLPTGPVIGSGVVSALADRLRQDQPGFEVTGGLHAAGIFDPDGSLLVSAEDVGRHNAVDKAIGALAGARWPLGEVILQVSGRLSFEIAQKAAVAGIPIVAGVSAASSLAVDLAVDLGLTLIGFTRRAEFTIYAGVERITPDSAAG